MGFFSRIKDTFSPPKLVATRIPSIREKPLWEQFQRIGGGIDPAGVSAILATADAGQPSLLIDLFNESRQKDGHLQGICGMRDIAVSRCDFRVVGPEPEKQKRGDALAIRLCQRAVEEFENWPLLVQHLTASYITGHATAEIQWVKTTDGYLMPRRCKPIHPRDFIFDQKSGALRYAVRQGDVTGVDLLADNPGRIIQIQRRINGDVPVREGLIRVLIWSALFRNWSLKDWIALGEVGWKPWRKGTYKKGASQKDIDELVDALERLGSTGVGAFPETTSLEIEWPKGMAPGTGGSGTHQGFFDTMGREMSKAVVGNTTTMEPGLNGDRASTETRDSVRTDIKADDAVNVMAGIRAHMFAPLCVVNIGEPARVPVPWFETEEGEDQLTFAQAVQALSAGGVRLPAAWVRGEFGAPEPKENDELSGTDPQPTDPNADPTAQEDPKKSAKAA
jgi:phage gp29-like protein